MPVSSDVAAAHTLAAVDAYLACAQIYLANAWDHELKDALKRALSLSVQLNDQPRRAAALDAHFQVLDALRTQRALSRYLTPLRSLLSKALRGHVTGGTVFGYRNIKVVSKTSSATVSAVIAFRPPAWSVRWVIVSIDSPPCASISCSGEPPGASISPRASATTPSPSRYALGVCPDAADVVVHDCTTGMTSLA